MGLCNFCVFSAHQKWIKNNSCTWSPCILFTGNERCQRQVETTGKNMKLFLETLAQEFLSTEGAELKRFGERRMYCLTSYLLPCFSITGQNNLITNRLNAIRQIWFLLQYWFLKWTVPNLIWLSHNYWGWVLGCVPFQNV